jgi:predicted MFS family arabinose efflux permease
MTTIIPKPDPVSPSIASSGTGLTPGRERWLLLTLAGIQFTNIVDFMIMMPLGPQLTQIFGISAAQFGLLVSSYNIAAGVSGFAAAFYIDRFDRKRLLLTLYLLFGVATLACGLAPTYESLMAARIAAGVFGGVLGTLAQTIVGDVIPFERRGRAMAIVMSAFSIATVAGVPIGLFLAAHWNWHAPFISLAVVCGLLTIGAWQTLPALRSHLSQPHDGRVRSAWSGFRDVLSEASHWRAFGFSVLLMFAGFVIIPYITIYMTSNGGMTIQQVPLVYLTGGIATLVTARLVGRLTDSLGKVRMFRIMALATTVPMLLITQVAPWGLWVVLPISTLFFIGMSGRMIPGMAILTSACEPRVRGTFMALNGSVQALAMGVAAYVGGLIITRDPQGQLLNYGFNAGVGIAASLIAVWAVGTLKLQDGTRPRGQ